MVLLAILTTSGLGYLRRAIFSAQKQEPGGVDYDVVVVVNTLNEEYAAAAKAVCAELGVECVRTPSDGTCATGKQSVYDLFLRRDHDYVTQLDGDDWLYPTWSLSVREHLRRAPGLDAVWLVPIDQINGVDGGVSWTTPQGALASVWGTSLWMPWPNAPFAGPGRDPMWDQVTPTTPAMQRLASRRAAALKLRHEAKGYDDYQLLMRNIAAHIRGDLQCWVSMASDWMIVDRGNPQSVQKSVDFERDAYLLRRHAREDVHPDRSWIGEFPIMYPPMQLTTAQKREWIDATAACAPPVPAP